MLLTRKPKNSQNNKLPKENGMNCKEMFGEAKWIAAGKYSNGPSKADANGLPHFPVIRKKFIYNGGKAEIRIAGLKNRSS